MSSGIPNQFYPMNLSHLLMADWPLPEGAADAAAQSQAAAWAAELAGLQAESIGWQPVGAGTYVHLGAKPAMDVMVVDVVGIPTAAMAGMNVVLLT